MDRPWKYRKVGPLISVFKIGCLALTPVVPQVLCENLARYGPNPTRVSAWNRTHSAAGVLAAQVEKCRCRGLSRRCG
jgi:hypothetical protein